MNEEKNVMSMDDILYSNEVKKGDIVKGTVVLVNPNEAFLDINQPSEARIFLDHYTNDESIKSLTDVLKVGDVIEVEITNINHVVGKNDDHTNILCSRRNFLKKEQFSKLKTLFDNNERINVKVVKQSDKGYFCAFEGFNLFMPKSQALKDTKVSDVLEVAILNINEEKLSAVVSAREVYNKDKEILINAEYEAINEGDVLVAKVVKILPFAVFLKYNHLQLRLNLNELDHSFVKKVEDLINVDDELEVKVLSKNNGKILVSRKALLASPFESYISKHNIGDTVEGKVVNKLPFGLLVELAPNVKGLLHSQEYSWNPNDNFNNCVNIDEQITVAILEINKEEGKIRLSRKALIDNPWSRVKANKYDVCTCKVVDVNDKALTVETLGVNGFILANDCISKNQNNKLTDLYAVGDELEAMIVDINPRRWYLKLSVNKLKFERERKEFEKYMNESKDESQNLTVGDLLKEVIE